MFCSKKYKWLHSVNLSHKTCLVTLLHGSVLKTFFVLWFIKKKTKKPQTFFFSLQLPFSWLRFKCGSCSSPTMRLLSLRVNARGRHPGSGVRLHRSPITVEVPAENLSVGGIVLTSKSCERNYWLTAT